MTFFKAKAGEQKNPLKKKKTTGQGYENKEVYLRYLEVEVGE